MRSILLLGIAFALAACGRDDIVSPPATIAGSYQLTTIDGQALPFLVFENGAYQARVVSGTLNLNANSSYSLAFNVRIDDSGNVRTSTQSDAGLWNVARDSITLASTAGNLAITGNVSGNVLTLQSSNITLVLRK